MAKPETEWVVDWTSRMAKKFGGIVRCKETGATYDWGQALCRECYGANWKLDGVPDDPTFDDMKRAQSWENGNWPDWAETPKEA